MSRNDRFDDAPYADDGPDLAPLPAGEESRLGAEVAASAGPGDAVPRPEFRASLRERFTSGRLEAEGAAPAAAPVRVHPVARRPRVVPRWAGAFAAAALLAIAVFAWLPRPAPETVASAWEIVAATADSTADPAAPARVNGHDVAYATLAAAGGTLAAGDRVELPPGVALELRRGDVLLIGTTPGAAFSVPSAAEHSVASVERGEVRFVTGPGFAGTRLVVDSPEARTVATGTSFAVTLSPAMTCVCVGEGSVRVTTRDDVAGAREVAVTAGRRREIHADGTITGELTLEPMPAMKMQMMRDRMGPAVSPRR